MREKDFIRLKKNILLKVTFKIARKVDFIPIITQIQKELIQQKTLIKL